jgi:hypothetical protein
MYLNRIPLITMTKFQLNQSPLCAEGSAMLMTRGNNIGDAISQEIKITPRITEDSA